MATATTVDIVTSLSPRVKSHRPIFTEGSVSSAYALYDQIHYRVTPGSRSADHHMSKAWSLSGQPRPFILRTEIEMHRRLIYSNDHVPTVVASLSTSSVACSPSKALKFTNRPCAKYTWLGDGRRRSKVQRSIGRASHAVSAPARRLANFGPICYCV